MSSRPQSLRRGRVRPSLRWWLVLAAASGLRVFAGTDQDEITAVYSKTSDDYVRHKQADGTYEAEAYAFGEGGLWNTKGDDTIDHLKFVDIAHTIAPPLAQQNYIPARDPKKTRLLIMVYWGRTAGTASGASSTASYQNLAASQQITAPTVTSDSSGHVTGIKSGDPSKSAQSIDESALFPVLVENRIRDQLDYTNAGMLGYADAMNESRGMQSTALRFRREDLIDELEDDRYFVVLMAYDFPLLWKEKKHKLVWETRFSIRERRVDFSKQLAAMAESASKYFGQDSHGLVRKPAPIAHVDAGEIKVIGTEPEKK
ncbi:MAG TPA: hypothetical protein VHD32_03330 [Candidatus Didemnitutus sp.]|nr:hypothetical protein [Candidatus Didemnitutus sp.]